ncbi:hypothetical protein VCHA53O466_40114 [Vibrio chagasii]|nr:hypothetical protein VCHA53O466_40114 [Vibrio chagasii]
MRGIMNTKINKFANTLDVFNGNFKEALRFAEEHYRVACYFTNSPNKEVALLSRAIMDIKNLSKPELLEFKRNVLSDINQFAKEVTLPILYEEGVCNGAQEAITGDFIAVPYPMYSFQGQCWIIGWQEGYKKEKGLGVSP